MKVTLSIDDETLVRARQLGRQPGLSLNEAIRDSLKTLTDLDPVPALSELENLWSEEEGDSGGWKWDREELYDRPTVPEARTDREVCLDERRVSFGVQRALALNLYEAGQLTPAQAARLAGLALEGFIELLGQAGIDAVNYSPEDLKDEVKAVTDEPSHRD